MSHIVNIKTEVRDVAAVRAACRRLNLTEPVHGKVKLFSGEAVGLAVRLPDWRYPVVCHTATGQIEFDNFDGRWGEQKQLDRFMQSYAVEKAKIESRRQGYSVTERPLADGSIKLVIEVSGGAA